MTKHEPKPGRLAFVCLSKEHEKAGLAYRVFADPDRPPPLCPSHGRMVPQENKPYLDQKIPAA